MRTKPILFLIAVVFSAVSCVTEQAEKEPVPTRHIELSAEQAMVLRSMRGENNRVSREEVIEHANAVIAQLDMAVPTRGGKQRAIASITPMVDNNPESQVAKLRTQLRTRGETEPGSDISDTLVYLVNFADSAGFTLIAADTRIPESVLAYVADGTLDPTQELTHPGMAVFLTGLDGYMTQSIIDANDAMDLWEPVGPDQPLDGAGPAEPNPGIETINRTVIGEWQTTKSVTPLTPVEWDQDGPFNDLVKYTNCANGTAPAGCVAVAVAQIMSHWKFPTNIAGHDFDWNTLNQYTDPYSFGRSGRYKDWTGSMSGAPAWVRTQVTRLMAQIGSDVGMTYRCTESSAKTSRAIHYFQDLGYTTSAPLDYNYTTIVNSLDLNRPVFAVGYATKIPHTILGIVNWSTYENGHAWVIDGYLQRKRYIQKITEKYNTYNGRLLSTTTTGYYEYSQMLHNNWGWGGSDNGYFVAGSFNSLKGPDAPSNTTRAGEGTPKNYQFENEFFLIYR